MKKPLNKLKSMKKVQNINLEQFINLIGIRSSFYPLFKNIYLGIYYDNHNKIKKNKDEKIVIKLLENFKIKYIRLSKKSMVYLLKKYKVTCGIPDFETKNFYIEAKSYKTGISLLQLLFAMKSKLPILFLFIVPKKEEIIIKETLGEKTLKEILDRRLK